MGETNKSILPLNKVSDLKKKVLFTLNVFKKPFGWVVFFLSLFNFMYIYIYIGNKEFCILRLNHSVTENEIKIY